MIKAFRYTILRNVMPNSRTRISLGEEPVRVATLVNEADFASDQVLRVAAGGARNAVLCDRLHDWNFRDGVFRYFTASGTPEDVVVVFEEDANYQPTPKFDPQIGKPLVHEGRA